MKDRESLRTIPGEEMLTEFTICPLKVWTRYGSSFGLYAKLPLPHTIPSALRPTRLQISSLGNR